MDENEQIRELTKRIESLENEVSRLKAHMDIAAERKVRDLSEPIGARPLSEPIGSRPSPMKAYEPIKRHDDEYENEEKREAEENRATSATRERNRDLEGKVGKTVMSILASVLIFVSIILFAKMFYKYIPDGAKVGLMFAVSIGVSVVGLVKMSEKARYNVLFTSLAGCGVGAVYISCMLTHFVFGMINQIMLMALVFIWLVATMALAKYKSEIFVYICSIGLIVATFMAAAQWKDNVLATCLYIAVLLMLYFVKHTNDNRDYFYFIQLPVVGIFLSMVHMDSAVGQAVPLIMLAVCYGVLAYVCLMYKEVGMEKKANVPAIIFSGFNIIATFALCSIYSQEMERAIGTIMRKVGRVDRNLWQLDGPGILAICLLLAGCALYFFAHYKKVRYLFYIWLSACIASVPVMFMGLAVADYVMLIPVVPVIIIIGVLLKNKYVRFAGYFWAFVHLYKVIDDLWYVESLWVLAITVVILAVLAVVVLKFSYHFLDKYLLCFALMAYSWGIMGTALEYAREITGEYADLWYWLFFIISAISVFMNTRFFVGKDDNKIGRILGYIVNAICLTFGIFALREGWENDKIATVVLIVSVLALSFVNIKNLFDSWIDKTLVGVYTCIKYTIVTYTILDRFETVSYLVSVVLIAVAIAFIVAGFKFAFRAPRIYGLVLTILCIFKLVLFDIEYDSNVMKPVGFFIAGVLCFGISYIYSKLEKQLKSE